ncbi:MAG: acylneuraminate cytidylyltransferase family protein [Desulfuromonadales bacterium]|nr:acylneuraminate cytidylyltransferase family protein [Desulfuromonadales bacterium]
MYKNKKILAIIPARAGSKGLPGKNTRRLGDKPLIAWSIEAAKASRYIDGLIVSTDDKHIAQVAEAYGIPVPSLRPRELATDRAQITNTLLHVIDELNRDGEHFDLLLLLQPTSPLRTASDIDTAIELREAKNAQAIVSVCETDHHPWLSNTLPEDDNMGSFIRPEISSCNRQDFPSYYRLNGAIYLVEIPFFQENHTFYGPRTYAYRMPAERSIDIDHPSDFLLAQLLLPPETDL